jgi:predicted CoA-binding protein
MDLADAQEYFPLVKEALEKRGVEILPISAVAQQNVRQVIQRSFQMIDKLPEEIDIITVEADDVAQIQSVLKAILLYIQNLLF